MKSSKDQKDVSLANLREILAKYPTELVYFCDNNIYKKIQESKRVIKECIEDYKPVIDIIKNYTQQIENMRNEKIKEGVAECDKCSTMVDKMKVDIEIVKDRKYYMMKRINRMRWVCIILGIVCVVLLLLVLIYQ